VICKPRDDVTTFVHEKEKQRQKRSNVVSRLILQIFKHIFVALSTMNAQVWKEGEAEFYSENAKNGSCRQDVSLHVTSLICLLQREK